MEENVEDAVTWNCQLVLVQEVVLDALLVVLIRIEVVVLQIVQEATRDRPDSLDVVDSGRKLLFAMLDGILKVLEGKDQLEESVSVELETSGVLGTLRHVVGLVEHYDAVLVVEGVVWPHRLIQHVVVGHENKVGGASPFLVHVERANLQFSRNLVQVFDIVRL